MLVHNSKLFRYSILNSASSDEESSDPERTDLHSVSHRMECPNFRYLSDRSLLSCHYEVFLGHAVYSWKYYPDNSAMTSFIWSLLAY